MRGVALALALALALDDEGRAWLGTKGVQRWDGATFLDRTRDDSDLPGEGIVSLAVDGTGQACSLADTTWTCKTLDGEGCLDMMTGVTDGRTSWWSLYDTTGTGALFCTYDTVADTQACEAVDGHTGGTPSAAVGGDGTVFLSSQDGLFAFDGSAWTRLSDPLGGSGAIAANASGSEVATGGMGAGGTATIWVHNSGGVASQELPAGNDVSALVYGPQGNLWVGTNQGLFIVPR